MKTIIFLIAVSILAGCKEDDFTKHLSDRYEGYLYVDVASVQQNGYDSAMVNVSKLTNEKISLNLSVHVVDTIYITRTLEAIVSEGGNITIPPYTYLSHQGIELTIEGSGYIDSDSLHFVAQEDGLVLTTFTYSGSAQ